MTRLTNIKKPINKSTTQLLPIFFCYPLLIIINTCILTRQNIITIKRQSLQKLRKIKQSSVLHAHVRIVVPHPPLLQDLQRVPLPQRPLHQTQQHLLHRLLLCRLRPEQFVDAVGAEHARQGGLQILLEGGHGYRRTGAEAIKTLGKAVGEQHAQNFLDDIASQVFLIVLGELGWRFRRIG